MASDPPVPYSIGSDTWPGLSRLAADAAQVVRVAWTIMGNCGDTQPDAEAETAGLRESLQEELGDLRAAIDYVIGKNALDWDAVNRRRDRKRSLYERGADEDRVISRDHDRDQHARPSRRRLARAARRAS
jgi:hypothetical protein